MAATKDEMISTLNDLIETCKDGEQGYRTAAESVKNGELKPLFTSYAQQRGQFGTALREELRALGGDPEKSGSVAGALHRGWINVKSAVTSDPDEGAIIAECERGEDEAVKNYKAALEKGLPSKLNAIVQQQFRQVQQAYDRIRAMELATTKA